MNLQLHNYFRSSTSYRVRIALHLKHLPFEYVPVHLLNNGGEQNSSEYRLLNPMGEVPTLIVEGKVLSQSLAILDYLDVLQPEPLLFPQEPFQKAKVLQACETINAGIHPITNLKVNQQLVEQFGATDEQKKVWQQKWIHQGLTAFDAITLPFQGKFCFGDRVSAADILLVPQLFSARRFGVDVSKYPHLLKIEKNCAELSAFQKAHPNFQPDTPDDFKGKLA